MVTIRLANAQAVADVMLALRRDALSCENQARAATADGRTAAAGRLLATARRLDALADHVNEQLTLGEKVEVARCG